MTAPIGMLLAVLLASFGGFCIGILTTFWFEDKAERARYIREGSLGTR